LLKLGGEYAFRPRRHVVPKSDQLAVGKASDEPVSVQAHAVINQQKLIGQFRGLWEAL